MSSSKSTALPAILIASDLVDGDVVFGAAHGWTRDPDLAQVAYSQHQASVLQSAAAADVARQKIVDPYLVEVTIDAAGRAEPRHFRERFRMLGPSVRPDLGKQADFSRLLVAAE